MTISSETSRSGPYNGNGSTTEFSYTFRIVDEAHLSIVQTDADGVETTLTLTTHYTVSGVGDDGGGLVTLVTAPPTGETITIIRNVPFLQSMDLENQGAYFAETIEDAFDLAAMRDQQMQEELDRAVKVSTGSTTDTDTLAAALLDVDAIAADVSTVAGIDTDVTTVAGVASDVSTVADNIADVVAASGSVLSLNSETDTGDGSTVAFTLANTPTDVNSVLIWVGGVRQVPTTDYTLSGATVTFATAPGSGVAIEYLVIGAVSTEVVKGYKDDAEAAEAAAEAAAASVAATYATVSALDAETNIIAGQRVVVTSGYNGEPETFEIVAASTYTANSQEVYDLSGSGLQAVSLRTWFKTVTELLADTRAAGFFAADPSASVDAQFEAQGFRYDQALSGASDEHVTTAGGVKLYVLRNAIVDATAFGIVADDSTDNATAISALNAYLVSEKPETVVLPHGVVRSSVPIENKHGANFTCNGICQLYPTSSDLVYQVGGGDDAQDNLPAINANISAGDTTLTFASAPDLSRGDVLFVASSLSTNSSGANTIQLFKEWLIVESVSGSTVSLYTPTRYSHTYTDDMTVARVDCVGGTTENIEIVSDDPPFSGSYPWAVNMAYQHTFRNFRSVRSASFVAFADKIAFEDSVVQGFNSGASVARNSGTVSFARCDIRTGPSEPTGTSGFFEESPDVLILEDCDYTGVLTFTNSSDNTPPKTVRVRGGRVYSPGIGVTVSGYYNADHPAVTLDNVVFYAPGGTGAAGVTTVISCAFMDSIAVRNCSFPDAGASAYTISFASVGAVDLHYVNNDPGASLGPHSSADALFRTIDDAKHIRAQKGLKLAIGGSGDANTLDYYEEGTFTATLTTTGTDFDAVSYFEQEAYYVKIGRVVAIEIDLDIQSVTKGSATGDVVIGGLPFAGTEFRRVAMPISNVFSWSARPHAAQIVSNESQIRLYKWSSLTADDAPLQVADVNTGANKVTIGGTYVAAT